MNVKDRTKGQGPPSALHRIPEQHIISQESHVNTRIVTDTWCVVPGGSLIVWFISVQYFAYHMISVLPNTTNFRKLGWYIVYVNTLVHMHDQVYHAQTNLF